MSDNTTIVPSYWQLSNTTNNTANNPILPPIVNSLAFQGSIGEYRIEFNSIELQSNEIERILLRYNKFMKILYKRYTEYAILSRPSGPYVTTLGCDSYIKNWSNIEQLIFSTRNLCSSQRLLCMDVEQFIRFIRESQLFGTTTCNAYDIIITIHKMRQHHRYVPSFITIYNIGYG